jgi:hypothetical protein
MIRSGLAAGAASTTPRHRHRRRQHEDHAAGSDAILDSLRTDALLVFTSTQTYTLVRHAEAIPLPVQA